MNCYLCRNLTTLFLQKNGYLIYRCSSCGLLATDLSQSYSHFINQHYTKGYFIGDPAYSAYSDYKNDKPHIVKNMQKFLAKIMKIKKSGKLLDVGCAMGYFVELASSRGFDAYGFDPSEYAITQADESLKRRLKIGTSDTVNYSEKSFDVITLFDVFEHLGDPKKDLKKLFSFLKDDGIIVIATGDTASILPKLIGRRWTFYIPPQHLFFFNKNNLSRIMTESGFEPKIWFRIGKWLSLRYVLLLAKTTGESKFAQWVFQFIEKGSIGRIPLHLPVQDNMVLIAGKYAARKQ